MVAVVHVGVREVFRPAARVAHLWPGLGIPAETRLPAAGCVRASLVPCVQLRDPRSDACLPTACTPKFMGSLFISSQPIKSFGPRRKERLKGSAHRLTKPGPGSFFNLQGEAAARGER